jgi:tetratricopeptide (TPR) repeat protein
MDNVANAWDLPLDHRTAEHWKALAEALAGRRLYGDSDFVQLEPEKFRAAWQSLGADQIRSFASTAEQAVAWHRREAFDCRLAGQWFASAWHLSRLIELDPASAPQAFARRARSNAEIGEWLLAAADYRRAEEQGVHDPEGAYHQALLSLAAGDAPGYRQVCAELLEPTQNATDPNQINASVWTCVLAPGAAADLSPLVRPVEQLLEQSPGNPAVLNTLGAICLRAGDADSATRYLQAAIKGNNNLGTPWDWLFLALAEHRRGQMPESRHWLEKAAVWIDRETNARTRGTSGERLGWEHRLELRLLRSEAETAGTEPADEK